MPTRLNSRGSALRDLDLVRWTALEAAVEGSEGALVRGTGEAPRAGEGFLEENKPQGPSRILGK